ncbi:uncharacterized protein [Miscanthus floridulus]|uniref:uncharacterized protein n=1 Tax=Miscanthus floridulus TaxID=154761 RepID=UPI0034591A80
MATGGEAGGKKRKASSVAEDVVTLPARREPRRGLGVVELERIRVALEMAERCYAAASSLSTPHQPPPALPPAALVVHAAGVAAAPAAHHQGTNTLFTTNGGHPSSH